MASSDSIVTLRFDAQIAPLNESMLLESYWRQTHYYRPRVGVYLVGTAGRFRHSMALIDTGSDFTVFNDHLAEQLGLTPPFARTTMTHGAGADPVGLSCPEDGMVSLFVTDYRHYCFLPAPLVGFVPSRTVDVSVLGTTAFLRHFKFELDHGPRPPRIALTTLRSFPGRTGRFSASVPLAEQFRRLRARR